MTVSRRLRHCFVGVNLTSRSSSGISLQPMAAVVVPPEAGQTPRSSNSALDFLHRWWPVLALAAVAAIATLGIGTRLLPLYSGNNDEPVYVFQARTIEHGHLTVSAALHDQSFRPWLTAEHNGRLLTQYQPGRPTVLAASKVIFGNMRVGIALVAAATVVAVGAFSYELVRNRRVTFVACAVLLLSPLFLLHWSLFLAYGFATLAVTTMGALLLRGVRTGRANAFVGAGVAFGVAQLTRPLDAVLFALPLAVFSFRQLRPGKRSLRSAVLPVAGGAAPFLVLTLAYNAVVTGSPFRFALMATDPRNRFGFGDRGILAGEPVFRYPIHTAVDALRVHLSGGVGWIFGGGIAIGLVLLAVVRSSSRSQCLTLAAVAIAFPIGYFFWWATALSAGSVKNGMGPHYYVPALVPLVVLVAMGLMMVLSWRRSVAVVLALLMFGLTVSALRDKVQVARSVTREHRRVYDAVKGHTRGESLVFLPDDVRYILSPYPFFMNDPGLNGRTVYARDLGARDWKVLDRFPSRNVYRLRNELKLGGGLFDPTLRLLPVHREDGPALHIRLRIRAPAIGVRLTAYIEAAGQRREIRIDGGGTDREPHEVNWAVVAPGASQGLSRADGSVELPATSTTFDVVVGVIVTDATRTGAAADRFERRLPARVGNSGGRPSVEAQRPGIGWHLAHFPSRAVWLRQSIDGVIAEIG